MATQECDQSGFQGFIKVMTVWECEYPRRFPLSSLWKTYAINSRVRRRGISRLSKK